MKTKIIYEKEILKDIQDLPEPMQEKLAKIIHLLKKELVQPELKEKSATNEFLSVCGTWEDDRSIEEQIRVIYSSRKSSTKSKEIRRSCQNLRRVLSCNSIKGISCIAKSIYFVTL